MKNLFSDIENSYIQRCNNHKLQKEYWNKIAEKLDTGNLLQNPRPSLNLTLLSGDPGISLLWIVQSTLVKNLLKNLQEELYEINPKLEIISKISQILKNKKSIGALAHSEDKKNPVILSPTKNNNESTISGIKKYITGGINADFILLTSKNSIDNKIENLIYLENNSKIKNSMENLDLKYLKTTCHGRLKLEQFIINNDSIIPISAKKIRKEIKIWSILERSLILETLLGFLIYLHDKIVHLYGKHITNIGKLKNLLNIQKEIVDKQIKDAINANRIEETFADMVQIFNILNDYTSFYKNEMNSLPEELKYRFMDLAFLEIMKKQ